jgi:hypothetical protein
VKKTRKRKKKAKRHFSQLSRRCQECPPPVVYLMRLERKGYVDGKMVSMEAIGAASPHGLRCLAHRPLRLAPMLKRNDVFVQVG